MAPRTGDTIDGRTVVSIKDHGHDTALYYQMSDGTEIAGAHWDFEQTAPNTWHHSSKWFSNWASA